LHDLCAERAYRKRDPIRVATVEKGGARSFLAVPMLKDNDLIGAIVIYRQEVRPFTQKQVELVSNFAAQAVIAIENTRLLNELRESLEQQTATSEVLSVISSSPGELQPVFEAMLANATRICDAKFGTLILCEGDSFRRVALHGAPPAYEEAWHFEPVVKRGRGTIPDQVMRTKRVVHIPDLQPHQSVKLYQLAGARTIIAVPMI